MPRLYSLGIIVDGKLEPIKPSKLTKESGTNILDIVNVTLKHSSMPELIEELEDITGKKISDVKYIVGENDEFIKYNIIDERIKFSDAKPYYAEKNERLLFSFKKNYFNKSFVTGLVALAMRKYNLDKDYKRMYTNLDLSDDEELVHLLFRGVRPNDKVLLPDIVKAKDIYYDVKNSIDSNVYKFDVEKAKDFIVTFLTENANRNGISKNVFKLGSYLYKFDRSVAYNTNKDIVDSYEYGEEFLEESDVKREVIETDFYPFYKENQPKMTEEEYYSQKLG